MTSLVPSYLETKNIVKSIGEDIGCGLVFICSTGADVDLCLNRILLFPSFVYFSEVKDGKASTYFPD
jgi:hypothetical protein